MLEKMIVGQRGTVHWAQRCLVSMRESMSDQNPDRNTIGMMGAIG